MQTTNLTLLNCTIAEIQMLLMIKNFKSAQNFLEGTYTNV